VVVAVVVGAMRGMSRLRAGVSVLNTVAVERAGVNRGEKDQLDQQAAQVQIQCNPGEREEPMAESVNLYEAKTHLSELVERAAAGEEIIIAKAGKPRARLVPLPEERVPRRPGGWEGQIWIADDFDAPLPPEILAAFMGENEEDAP
jgi:prevent-host-death family protein